MNENENVAMQLATTRKFGELEIQVYENPAVGHSRVQDDFWMTREQIGTALEYSNPMTAIKNIHNRNTTRLDPLSTQLKMSQVEGKRTVTREVVCYNLRGVMEICRYSTQPKANAFIDFCWDVMVALMQGETVSLNRGQVSDAESRRQARFEIMTQGIEELRQSQNQLCSQMAEMEEKRRQDREALENLIHFTKADLEKAERIVSKRNPPMIPASMIPTRHKIEDFPMVLSPETPGGDDIKVVAEVQAVEVEAPVVETPVAEAPAVKEPKKKYYYKPSITLPIVEPIAKKLGDKTIGYWVTYAKIYDTIGVVKMDRMRKAYVRSHNKPPKATPDIFQCSDKNMKVFKEAAKIVAAAI